MGKRTKADAKVAVGYIRASKDEQKLTADAQRHAIQSWADREGVTIVSWHVDQGVSSESDLEARAGLMAALVSVKEHGAGLLVLLKRDRLARDSYVALGIERAVEKCGAKIVTADGVANGDNPADAFMRTILDGVAQYELALIRARTVAALAVKKSKGERVGGIPYGKQLQADGIHLEVNPAEQAVITAARRLRTNGVTYRAIVTLLREDGYTSRSGKPFGLRQVARMLSA